VGGALKFIIIEREIYQECQRGELRAKGKTMLIIGRKGKCCKPLSFLYNILFFPFFSILF
jgi:hypothetical protein